MHARNRQSGFTLVEMVVVIGIIGALLGLLLPTLSSFRAEADSTLCANNLRQIMSAVEGYRQRHDGLLPACEALPRATPDGPVGGLPPVLKGDIPIDSPLHQCPRDYECEIHGLGTSYTYLPGAGMLLLPVNMQMTPEQNAGVNARIATQNYDGQFANVFPLLYDAEDWHTNTPRTPKNAVFIDGSVRKWGAE